MSMIIRHAKLEEMDSIMEVYSVAKKFMNAHGNEKQWAGSNAVSREKIQEMLEKKQLFVGVQEAELQAEDALSHRQEEELQFVFAYIQGDDPTYKVITEGEWLNDESYGTIHRLASAGKQKGVLKQVTDWALKQERNIRIDTHHDNVVMQNALIKEGYKRCGIIYLANGDPRIAYQKVI